MVRIRVNPDDGEHDGTHASQAPQGPVISPMPDPTEMPIGQPGAPGGGMPPGGAQPAPMGSGPSPATMPVANRGMQMTALAQIGNVVDMLHMIAAAVGPGHEASVTINRAINELTKVVPPGATSQGLLARGLEKLQAQRRQNQMNALAMRNQGAAPPPPPAPPAAMPQAA